MSSAASRESSRSPPSPARRTGWWSEPKGEPVLRPLGKGRTWRDREAVCVGHPDRLGDTIAERIVALAMARDPEALVGVEVALHRSVVFVDGRVAAGRETAAVEEDEIVALVRQAFADAGYGATPSGVFRPEPKELEVRTDRVADADRLVVAHVADGPLVLGQRTWGPRAGHRPLEQALASDFAAALERLRVDGPGLASARTARRS